MNKIINEEIDKAQEVYMENIIVKSKKEEQHEEHLANVFNWVV